MASVQLLQAEKKHFNDVLKLNKKLVRYLSEMDLSLCEHLHKNAQYFYVICNENKVEACVIALEKGKEYASENYKWFSQRYENFIYIDRIIVSEKCQGKGYGKLIYNKIFDMAKKNNYKYIAAEIDIMPRNEPSLLFHEKIGFMQVGTQFVKNGEKQVSLQIVEI